MTHDDWLTAARLALPSDARATGVTRLRALGLDIGAPFPLHYVVARDLHLAINRVCLHRTEVMPPTDAIGVTPAAAFIEFVRTCSVLDAIAVGDWLLHHQQISLLELRELAHRDTWRAGAPEALWISDLLDGRSRSPRESRSRAYILFAGLPVPEANFNLIVGGQLVACLDLYIAEYLTAIEYEGGHHQTDRGQYLHDVGRYADLRALGVEYVQVTKEKERTPIKVVLEIHRCLTRQGYAGPPPDFGPRWRSLGGPIRWAMRINAQSATHTSVAAVASTPNGAH